MGYYGEHLYNLLESASESRHSNAKCTCSLYPWRPSIHFEIIRLKIMQAYFADICISITRLTKNIKVWTSQISLEKTRVKRKTIQLVFVLSSLKQQYADRLLPHSDTLSWYRTSHFFALSLSCCVLSVEATNTNFIVFRLTRVFSKEICDVQTFMFFVSLVIDIHMSAK
jgi:hypothetical protein